MRFDPDVRRRAFMGLAMVASLYVIARSMRWTGPNTELALDHEILIPGMVVVTLWGLARALGRTP